MRVSEDHGVDVREARPHARQPPGRRPGVVDHRHAPAGSGDGRGFRQLIAQLPRVDVAVDGVHRRTEPAQVVEDRGGDEVTGVQDEIGSGQRPLAGVGKVTLALGQVGVGDDGQAHGAWWCGRRPAGRRCGAAASSAAAPAGRGER